MTRRIIIHRKLRAATDPPLNPDDKNTSPDGTGNRMRRLLVLLGVLAVGLLVEIAWLLRTTPRF